MEEAKTLENAKLQNALQEVQIQLKESKFMVIKEREAAKKAIEESSLLKKVPVIDTALVDKLATENKKLKVYLYIN